MNKLKRELRKKGIKLEIDYPYLPNDDGIQGITVDSETASFKVYHTSIVTEWTMRRDGTIEETNWFQEGRKS